MTIKPMLGFVFLLALALGGCNWGKKAPECKVLVNSMSELGERLADARKVVGASEVNLTEVSDALRPFAVTAKNVADFLNAKVLVDRLTQNRCP